MTVLSVFNRKENNIFTLDAISTVVEHYREAFRREKSSWEAVRSQR